MHLALKWILTTHIFQEGKNLTSQFPKQKAAQNNIKYIIENYSFYCTVILKLARNVANVYRYSP